MTDLLKQVDSWWQSLFLFLSKFGWPILFAVVVCYISKVKWDRWRDQLLHADTARKNRLDEGMRRARERQQAMMDAMKPPDPLPKPKPSKTHVKPRRPTTENSRYVPNISSRYSGKFGG